MDTLNLGKGLVLALLLALVWTGCDSNDSDPIPPEVTGPMRAEGPRGTDVDLTFDLTAEAGIQSLTVSVDGGAPEALTVTQGSVQQSFTYTFSIPGAATLGTEFDLMFTLTDEEGNTSEIDAVVTTAPVIATPPSTYEFTRNGQTSVSYSGQTDRLDQLDEIKAYLKTGDAGALMDEQVLLDMFANTGGNGGGNFSFTSDRQLKNKT